MARKALIEKQKRKPKFKTRRVVEGKEIDVRFNSRCQRCGRSRAYLRDFGLCRICFRDLALAGMIPGVRKSSW